MIKTYEKKDEIRNINQTKESAVRIFCGLFLLACFALAVAFSAKSREALLGAMILCAKNLIPSVFLFAVIGNLIGSSAAEFPRFMTFALSKIFGVGEEGAKALLPGLFAGFPVGVSAAVRLYERGRIDKYEFDRICAFSCTPGGAFVISGVGEGMFADKTIGVVIYISVMLSVFIVGFLTKKRKTAKNTANITFENTERPRFSEVLSDAVIKSSSAMLVMTAFVAFFSQVTFFASLALSTFTVSEHFDAILKAFFEVSQACRASAELGGMGAVMLSAFACAWSGLSFQMQTLAIGGKYSDSFSARKTALCRLAVALLSVIICALICKVLEIS